MNSRGKPSTTTFAPAAARDWIAEYTVLSRPASVLLMKLCAVVMSPSQLTSGSAHLVMTLEKPASLPPIVMVTMFVELVTALIWLFITSAVFAPEQATKLRFVFGRSCLIRY